MKTCNGFYQPFFSSNRTAASLSSAGYIMLFGAGAGAAVIYSWAPKKKKKKIFFFFEKLKKKKKSFSWLDVNKKATMLYSETYTP